MNEHIKNLPQTEIDFMKTLLGEQVYKTTTEIIYRGQIPIAAYILIEGKILLKDNQKRVIHELSDHHLIGFKEICENKPFKYTAEIQANSKVLILDRSSINQIKQVFENQKPKESFVTEALLTSIA